MPSGSERTPDSDGDGDGLGSPTRRDGVEPSGSDDVRIGAILLAAGESRRFGDENKLLATLEGEPLVRRAARTLVAADLAGVGVVVGHESERVRGALDDLDVTIRHNPEYADGQSSSVRVGAEAAASLDWDAAIFALGDMPWVDPATIDRLCAAYRSNSGSILAPSFDGRRGNPVLFDAAHFDALAGVSGDRGGRDLIENHDGATLIPVDDPGVLRDVDERADLRALE